ncbi:autoinducer binding domain-containing protein [Pseudomonas sp. PCH446]
MELAQLWVWDLYFYSLFAKAMNMEEFTGIALNAITDLKFDFYAYGLCSLTPFMRPKTHLYSNYPAQWVERYQSMNYAVVDPTVKHSRLASTPILWSDDIFKGSLACGRRPMIRSCAMGWPSLVQCPRRVGLLSLARKDKKIGAQEFTELAPITKAFADAVYAKLSDLEGMLERDNDVVFTERESEVLRWTADGKTSEEIGVIMGVCTDTVNYHHKNIQRKIGASNRVQAVTYAVALGYI